MAGSFTVTVTPESGPGDSSYTVAVTSHDGFKGTVALECSTESTTCQLVATSLMVCEDETKQTSCAVGPVTVPDQLTVTGTSDGLEVSGYADLYP